MRIYLAVMAVLLIGVACGSNDDAVRSTPVAPAGVATAPGPSNPTPTTGPAPSNVPTATDVPSSASREPSEPSPTNIPMPPTVEPTAVPSLTPTSSPTGIPPELRYLALGDSYTIGEGVAPSLRWPVQLAERVRSAGIAVGATEIVARTGWTTLDLAAGIDAASPHGPYDMVTLLIGVNDQFRGRPVESFRQGFNDLLQRAIAFASDSSSRVIVVSIPDWGATPFASGLERSRIGAEIDLFNKTAEEESAQAGALFVDITGISREAETDLGLVASDGLHPSGAMYERWVELILPEALAILE